MKRMLLVSALALSLSACFPTSTNLQELINQTRDTAVKVCGFLPTVDTVASIIALNHPAYQTAKAIADAVCAAVTSAPRAGPEARAVAPKVAGVEVKGEFVRRE